MVQIEQIFDAIPSLSQDERNELMLRLLPKLDEQSSRFIVLPLHHPISDFPGIVSTPGVCGGAACIIRTRIPVWTLERMRQLGVRESEILQSYPTLYAADLVQAWAYVREHEAEVERDIRRNEEEVSTTAIRPLELD